jgi:hypothetical protein
VSATESRPPDERETITVGKGTYTSHYNAHSIAYVRNLDASLTPFGWVAVFAPILLSIIIAARVQDFIAEILQAGFLMSTILYISLYTSNSTEVGTLNGRDSYSRSVDDMVSEVEEHAGETIGISSKIRGRYTEWTYRYHFVPKNIVKIEEKIQENGLTAIAVGIFTLFSTVVIYFVDDWPLSLFTLVVGTALAILIYDKQVAVRIHLKNGETEKFIMEPSDVRQVIDEFSSGVSNEQTRGQSSASMS